MIKKKTIKRLPIEVKSQLLEYAYDLIDDARNYDEGKVIAIKRSAVVLRSIFHDTNMSNSILNQIGDKEHIIFNSYFNSKNKYDIDFGQLYIASFRANTPSNYCLTYIFHPSTDYPIKKIHFEDWWNGDIIRLGGANFSRKDIVLTISNKDGVAHFDEKIDQLYDDLKKGKIGWHFGKTESSISNLLFGTNEVPSTPPVHIELALLREIVHETLTSLIYWYNLPIKYNPDFDAMWKGKLNELSFQMYLPYSGK